MSKLDRNRLIEMYRWMYLSRRSEERLVELYRQGIVKGTVTTGEGNEAAIVGVAAALDAETDICNFMQRDFAGYLVWGVTLYHLFSHYIANKDSYTKGRDGNVHHGIPERGLLPMVSHLGTMLPNVVGAVHARRKRGIPAVGVAVIGDGGTSTGDFHEAVNIAAVLDVPVVFLVENNQWAYSTPNEYQFKCSDLSTRAAGYGIEGRTIKGVDVRHVHEVASEIVEEVRSSNRPYILVTETYRLAGHAAYDTADYVPEEDLACWKREDPLIVGRELVTEQGGFSIPDLSALEAEWDEEVSAAANKALQTDKIDVKETDWSAYCVQSNRPKLGEYSQRGATPVEAIRAALDLALHHDQDVFVLGEDIGAFGGPFKATKGLFEKYGRERIMDMPLAESGFSGFALGAAAMGLRPVVEMQFSDFSTDAMTQIGVNAGTFFYRTGHRLPLTIRMPGGGGLSYGPFHSEDLEGLFGTMPGLKLVYPSFVNDFFRYLLAAVYDDNPVLFFESKYLHRRLRDDIEFDGNVPTIGRGQVVREGSDLSIVAYGAMIHEALQAASRAQQELDVGVEVIDPIVLKPMDWQTVEDSVKKTHRIMVVHESWEACSVGSWIIAGILENVFFELDAPPLLCAAPNNPVPFAPELETVHRPNADRIFEKIQQLLNY